MNQEEMIKMVCNTDKAVAVLCEKVGNLVDKVDRMDKVLTDMQNEPKEDLKYYKRSVISIVISLIISMACLGMFVKSMYQANELKQIVKEYQE